MALQNCVATVWRVPATSSYLEQLACNHRILLVGSWLYLHCDYGIEDNIGYIII